MCRNQCWSPPDHDQYCQILNKKIAKVVKTARDELKRAKFLRFLSETYFVHFLYVMKLTELIHRLQTEALCTQNKNKVGAKEGEWCEMTPVRSITTHLQRQKAKEHSPIPVCLPQLVPWAIAPSGFSWRHVPSCVIVSTQEKEDMAALNFYTSPPPWMLPNYGKRKCCMLIGCVVYGFLPRGLPVIV